jgi:hypothetical protein
MAMFLKLHVRLNEFDHILDTKSILCCMTFYDCQLTQLFNFRVCNRLEINQLYQLEQQFYYQMVHSYHLWLENNHSWYCCVTKVIKLCILLCVILFVI